MELDVAEVVYETEEGEEGEPEKHPLEETVEGLTEEKQDEDGCSHDSHEESHDAPYQIIGLQLRDGVVGTYTDQFKPFHEESWL